MGELYANDPVFSQRVDERIKAIIAELSEFVAKNPAQIEATPAAAAMSPEQFAWLTMFEAAMVERQEKVLKHLLYDVALPLVCEVEELRLLARHRAA